MVRSVRGETMETHVKSIMEGGNECKIKDGKIKTEVEILCTKEIEEK